MNEQKHNSRPRAIATGLLWGRVDCCVLEDGRRQITQRGELRALRGNAEKDGGTETGNLGRYLARLPKRYAHLASGPETEFILPDGGVAIGRGPEHFVGVLRAYTESYAAGDLHASQAPMAKRAMDLLCQLAGKAIEQMIDEACNYRGAPPGPVTAEGFAMAVGAVLAPMLKEALAPLYGRIAALETRPAPANLNAHKGPTIGPREATSRILTPLREIAQLKAGAIGQGGNAKVRRKLRFQLDLDLRRELGYPMDRGHRWSEITEEQLNRATLILGRMWNAVAMLSRMAGIRDNGPLFRDLGEQAKNDALKKAN